MKEYNFNSEAENVDQEMGYFCRFVTGDKDNFYPHYHDYYEIFITVSGIVTHWINEKECELPEGSLVFIRPHDVHGYLYKTPQSIKTSYINLTFSKEMATQLFNYLSDSFPCRELLEAESSPYIILSDIEKKKLIRQISELNTVNIQDKKALKLRAKVLLADIFARFFYSRDSEIHEDAPLWLSHLLRNMEYSENFTKNPEHMVFLSGKSREHLSRSMRKYLGITPSDYINGLRINYASNLLINTDSQIIDICYSCGFTNLTYFYRLFKKKYGVSPKQFREKYKKN